MTWVLDVADFIIAIVNMLKVLQGNIKKMSEQMWK